MELLITIVHVTVALFMILVVLVQGGNQGGIGAAFGGGNTQGVFGASGATTLLGKLTYGAAFIFMVTTISLTVIQGQGGNTGLTEKLKKQNEKAIKKETPESATNSDAPVAPGAVAPTASPVEESKATETKEVQAVEAKAETEVTPNKVETKAQEVTPAVAVPPTDAPKEGQTPSTETH